MENRTAITKKLIVEFLQENQGIHYSRKEIEKYLKEKSPIELSEGVISGSLSRLCEKGVILNISYGFYMIPKDGFFKKIESIFNNFIKEIRNEVHAIDPFSLSKEDIPKIHEIKNALETIEELKKKITQLEGNK